MTSELVTAALLLALTAATILYGTLVSKRVHDRRVQARIQQTIHLYAVVRGFLAERRQAA
jgi:hypothetical protein